MSEKQAIPLHRITVRKKNKLILNTHNTDILLDGKPVQGLNEFNLSLKAQGENPSIAMVTLTVAAFVDFEQGAEDEAPAPAPAAPSSEGVQASAPAPSSDAPQAAPPAPAST